MNLDVTTLKEMLETMPPKDFLSLLIMFVFIVVVFIVAQGIAQAFTGWISKKLFKDSDRYKKKTTLRMQKSLTVNGNIQSELKMLREEIGANIIQVWLYSNGEKSFGGICFNYQSVKFEVVESGYPSLIQTSPKISTTATHYISKLMFDNPADLVTIDSVEYYDFPDKPIFKSMHIETLICAAIQTDRMTIGYVLVGWMYKEKGSPINKSELAAVNNTRHRISGMFETLEQI
jgi:hypothetical protein